MSERLQAKTCMIETKRLAVEEIGSQLLGERSRIGMWRSRSESALLGVPACGAVLVE
jgi:hypothetical protein